MEETSMRKRQLLLRRRKGCARPSCFLKNLTQVFNNWNPRAASQGWWPLVRKTSRKQDPAKLLLHLAIKWRRDNCKKRGGLLEA